MIERPGAVEVHDVSVTYPSQKALSSVSLRIPSAEIHGLIGENGSGKSTLIKCLAGIQAPDAGARMVVDGRETSLPSTAKEARALGLAFVHQELGLCPNLSVAENLALGNGYPLGIAGQIDWRELRRWARDMLQRAFGDAALHIPVDRPVTDLSVARQTLVAIARCLAGVEDDIRLIVLDEPTAALPAEDAAEVIQMLRVLRSERDVSVLLVSHRLTELIDVCDRISVLRDGDLVGTLATEGLGEDDLIAIMLGEKPESTNGEVAQGPRNASAEIVLEVADLRGGALQDASFTVRRGELVGIAGLVGSGRSTLLRLLFGVQPRESGAVSFNGRDYHPRRPRQAMDAGVGLVPEDRAIAGGVAAMAMGENITLAGISRFFRRFVLRRQMEKSAVRAVMHQYDIRPRMPDRSFSQFSGGNQQKAVLGKWLSLDPHLLLLDEPVQGVDINARRLIMSAVRQYAERSGAGVVVVDSDFENLAEFCDRILVMSNGSLVAEVNSNEMTRVGVSRAVQAGHLNCTDAERRAS